VVAVVAHYIDGNFYECCYDKQDKRQTQDSDGRHSASDEHQQNDDRKHDESRGMEAHHQYLSPPV